MSNHEYRVHICIPFDIEASSSDQAEEYAVAEFEDMWYKAAFPSVDFAVTSELIDKTKR